MNIIGFGQVGRAVAKKLSVHPQYDVFYIDVGLTGKNCYALPASKVVEEAEDKTPQFPSLVEKVKEEIFFFCGGVETISSSILATLEQFKHLKINVVYVRPNFDLLGEKEKAHERVVFGVLQQYARSGLFKRIILIDDFNVAEILGNLSIVEYRDKINSLIANSFHMLNYLKNSNFIMSNISPPHEINRISTLGIYSTTEDNEKYFYNIENIREKHFYFAFGEQTLNEEKNLLNKISKRIKKAGQSAFTNVSYDITATTYEEDFAYIEAHTNFIQGEKMVDNRSE